MNIPSSSTHSLDDLWEEIPEGELTWSNLFKNSNEYSQNSFVVCVQVYLLALSYKKKQQIKAQMKPHNIKS